MKIKLDENLPLALALDLRELDHDVHTVPDEGLEGQMDGRIWQAAQEEDRFLITQDLDFSGIRKFRPGTHQAPRRASAVRDKVAAEPVAELGYGQVNMVTGERTATEFGALHAFLPAVLVLGDDLGRAKASGPAYKLWNLHGSDPEVLAYPTMRMMHTATPCGRRSSSLAEKLKYLDLFTSDSALDLGRPSSIPKRIRCGVLFECKATGVVAG